MQFNALLEINLLKVLVNPVQTGTLKDSGIQGELVILKEEAFWSESFSLTFAAETHLDKDSFISTIAIGTLLCVKEGNFEGYVGCG